MREVTSFHWGIIQGKSPFTVIETGVARPLFGSRRWMRPACSKTTTPAPVLIVFTSRSRKRVTWVSWRDFDP